MTVKSKKILAGMAAGAIMAFTSLTVAASTINMPLGAKEWEACAGYGNVYAGEMVKTNDNTVSYFSFTKSPEPIKVWLTTYVTVSGNKGVASKGVLIETGDTVTQHTSASKGKLVTIEVSREHIIDEPYNLVGMWFA